MLVGYGAPGKGNTLLNYCGIRADFLDYTVDRNPYKQGKYLPGTHIPIFAPRNSGKRSGGEEFRPAELIFRKAHLALRRGSRDSGGAAAMLPARLESLQRRSLRAGRKIGSTQEIADPITNNASQIDCLRNRPPASSATVLRETDRPLRERAGSQSLDMTHADFSSSHHNMPL
jgi:hypothetical protein